MIARTNTTPEQRCREVGYNYNAQHKEPVTHCTFCGSSEQRQLATRDRYGFHARSVQCRGCGLVFLSPRLTPDGYEDFYCNWYRKLVSAYHNRRINAETIEAEQLCYAESWCNWAAPYIEKGGEVLDIGGSTGVIASEFTRRFKTHATIIDPSPDECERAQARGHDTFCGIAEDADMSAGGWSMVTMFQTIDHLLEPGVVLMGAVDALPSGGIMLVDIVDLDRVSERVVITGAIKIDHPFYFTRATAEMMWGSLDLVTCRLKIVGDHVRYILRKP